MSRAFLTMWMKNAVMETNPTFSDFDPRKLTPARAAELARLARARADLRPLGVYVLRSATLEPVIDPLTAIAAERGLLPRVALSGFGAPEIELARAGAELAEADVVIIALELVDLMPQAAADPLGDDAWIAATTERVTTLAESARKRSRAKLLVQLPLLSVQGLDGLGDLLQPDRAGKRMEKLRALLWERLSGEVGDCYALDPEMLIREEGLANLFDRRLWAKFRAPWTAAGCSGLALLWARAIETLVLPRAKVLALDLDNTLWGGVLGEAGKEGVTLAPDGPGAGYWALQRDALALARRGVLLAIASKNDEAQALDALATHPHVLLRPDLIAAYRINWNDKASSLREIATTLGLGLDSFVFVDDRATECELIRRLLPQVRVYQAPAAAYELDGFLLTLRDFDVMRTLEADHRRGADYQARRVREQQRPTTDAVNLDDYLASLKLEVCCFPARAAALERVAQMEAKTNQFNATTARLSRLQLDAIIAAGGEVFAASVKDRFGDYGIALSAALRVGEVDGEHVAVIESFLASCRVIGLGAESALLAAIADWARANGLARLEGDIRESERNAPVRALYKTAGFDKLSEKEGAAHWCRDLGPAALRWPAWIKRAE